MWGAAGKNHPNSAWVYGKKILFLFGFICFFGQPSIFALPIAETQSDITIAASVLGGGPYNFNLPNPPGGEINLGNGIALVANPNAQIRAGVATHASAVSIAGNDLKSATDPAPAGETDKQRYQRVSSYLFDVDLRNDFSKIPVKTTKDPFVNARTGLVGARSGPHSANALTNSLSTMRSFEVVNGGTFEKDPVPLGSFNIRQSTDAKASRAEAEGATANTLSRGLIEGAILKNRFLPPAAPVPAEFQPKVQLEWDFDSLLLRAEPTTAFALSHHTVEIQQTIGNQTQNTRVGFSLLMEDGQVKVQQFFEGAAGQTEMADWFTANTELKDNLFQLKGNAPNLKINVPLLAGFHTAGTQLTLNLESDNFESSLEITPRANGQNGPRAQNAPAGNPTFSLLHWNAEEQKLWFDDIHLSLLSDGTVEGTAPAYQSDLLADSGREIVMRIDPLQRLFSDNGLEYFSGTTLRILDGVDESVLYSAEMPVMVFDPSLFGFEGFNLFVPLYNEELFSSESKWLLDYLARTVLPPELQPQLFLGFSSPNEDGSWNGIWDSSFDISVAASLSFTQPVPEPGTLALLALGMVTLFWVRLPFRRDQKNP